MPKDYIQIDIPEPCDQKFSEMTPTHGGRFCSSCEKVIVDFTTMTDREIANTLHKNKGKICGQFRKSQLNKDIDLSIPSVNSYRGKAVGILLSGFLAAGTTQGTPLTPPIEIIDGQLTLNQTNSLPNQNIKIDKKEISKYEFKLKVIEKDTREELIAANIILKGTDIGTTTDIDGTATLSISSNHFENDNHPILIISYLGFSTQEIILTKEDISENRVIEIYMQTNYLIGEVITIGLIRRKSIRGFLSRTKYFFKRQAENFSYFLEDRKEIRQERRAERRKKRAEKKARKAKQKGTRINPKEQKNNDNKIITFPTPKYDSKINNIFPNPFSKEINIDLTSKSESDIEISIFDATGKMVYHAKQRVIKGQQNIKLQLHHLKLNNADYLLQIKDKEGAVQSKKLIKMDSD